eukprot:5363445-Pyramimonas_sp.AAC.1
MSQAVCLFSTSFAFGTDLEDVSSETFIFMSLRGAAEKGITRSRSRPCCGDVSSGVPVFCPSVFRFRNRFGGCLERGAHFHVPTGGRRG